MGEADSPGKREKYQRIVKEGLDRAFADQHVRETELDLDRDRLVIFSDHHRGAHDGADDFWRCERSYRAALGYYLEEGHQLLLLGDVEELWENRAREVLAAYGDTLALEREFYELGRLERFWGNHDDAWRHADAVKAHFESDFPGIVIHEALRLQATRGGAPVGLFFLVHGHQGTLDSDRFGALSRLAVRYGWRPIQQHFRMASTTPAQDFQLRAAHDDAMFEWASHRPEHLVLIAGHTHKPVFSTPRSKPERTAGEVQHQLDELRKRTARTEEIADLRAELELVRAAPFGDPPKEMPVPCYFNTGCCSFGDGDVTGIELCDGEIRLVRWLNDKYEPRVQQLAAKPVEQVFEQVRTAARG
jgi:predicted phosphodiesterase